MNVIKNDGSSQPLDTLKIQKATAWACAGLDVSQSELEVNMHAKLFDGIKTSAIQDALITSGGELISRSQPQFKFATARLLLQKVYKEVTGGPVDYPSLRSYITEGVKEGQLEPDLLDFNLEALEIFIKPERDLQFDYLGLQTLADRYLVRRAAGPDEKGDIIELPQHFFMRVCMGLVLRDVRFGKKHKADSDTITHRAVEAYELLSTFDYMTSTPTLFNAGTTHPQLSSCYLNTVADSLYSDHDTEAGHHFASIYGTIEECARLSKYAGGIGTDWNRVRPEGSIIKGTNGKSAGTVPYIKVWNDTAIAVNQGGKRNGAFAAYMEPWHPDFPAFCELKKNSGEERRRAHEVFPAAWIPDLFMQRVQDGGVWSFFAPDEFPELHERYGVAFTALYEELEAAGKFRSQMPAKALWQKMMTMLFETGHPWVTFKDECNVRSPQDHVGVVHSSNLCTEITLNTSDNETAVCNLGSINLANHVKNGKIDHKKLKRTIDVAVRLLDNVVDINFYPSIRAENSNKQHRPVGLGVMGLTDMLCQLGIDWESQECLELQDELFEAISYHAIDASSDLAVERGAYPSYDGSKWSRGIFPIDTARGAAKELTTRALSMNWAKLREKVADTGMRNSNLMAIAPTATIANICGVVPSIESPFLLEYTKTNLSGQFKVVTSALEYGVPVKEAFEVDQVWPIRATAIRGKWIDQSQSFNLFVPANIKGKELSAIYFLCWYLGLKTTYYLRRQVAETEVPMASKDTRTDAERDADELAALREARDYPADAIPEEEVKFCSISDPNCESCQ